MLSSINNEYPFISVIMPAYNAGQTIERSIDSVINQTFRNWELIIVDDGSLDETYNVCSHYDDTRINVFTQDNQGASASRNRALELCEGEYLAFIDSDDWYEPSFLEQIYQGLKDADLSVCGMAFHGKDVQTLNPAQNSFEFLQTFETGVMNSTCNKLYKRSVIQDCYIRFPEEKIGEDFLFNLAYLQQIDKVNYISGILYHYDNTHSTLTRRVSDDMFQTYYRTHLMLEQLFGKDLHEIVARIMYPQYCSLVMRYLQNVIHGQLSKKEVLALLRQRLRHPMVIKSMDMYLPCSKFDAIVLKLLKYNDLQLLMLMLRIVNIKNKE